MNSFPKILVDMHIYYVEESVLLGTKPLVDSNSIRHFIRDPSVAYFPYVTFVPVKHSPPYNK